MAPFGICSVTMRLFRQEAFRIGEIKQHMGGHGGQGTIPRRLRLMGYRDPRWFDDGWQAVFSPSSVIFGPEAIARRHATGHGFERVGIRRNN
jgi:hypothetical protein